MTSNTKETERSEHNAVEEVFEFYHDSGDELNTDEEEDGNFYDSYLDQTVSRSLTPSGLPNVQDDEFCEDSEECIEALAFPSPAELEDRLRSIKYKKRSRSSTVTLQNMHEREPGHNSNDLLESDDSDEEIQDQTESSGSSEWEPLA